jgi:hypothetical protein
MSVPPSTAINLTLPRWAYIPGVDTGADHDTLAMAKALVPARFNGFVPARHPALRYGLGLNDSGFFWESHEILEAVWAAAPQGGRERILLRACIQIANANLKLRMGKSHAAAHTVSPMRFRLRRLRACSGPNWRSRHCPKPIGSRSAHSAEPETKCRF